MRYRLPAYKRCCGALDKHGTGDDSGPTACVMDRLDAPWHTADGCISESSCSTTRRPATPPPHTTCRGGCETGLVHSHPCWRTRRSTDTRSRPRQRQSRGAQALSKRAVSRVSATIISKGRRARARQYPPVRMLCTLKPSAACCPARASTAR